MKRIRYITIEGKEYPLNFSIQAFAEIAERCGGVSELSGMIQDTDVVKRTRLTLWLLSLLMEQGAAYVRATGGEALDPPTENQLAVLFDAGSALDLQSIAMEAILAGMHVEIETEPEKNADATRED